MCAPLPPVVSPGGPPAGPRTRMSLSSEASAYMSLLPTESGNEISQQYSMNFSFLASMKRKEQTVLAIAPNNRLLVEAIVD